MPVQIETERRFLIKRLPDGVQHARRLDIEQYYTEGKVRYRQVVERYEHKYYRTKKKKLSPGVYEEDEVELTSNAFEKARLTCDRWVTKHRYVVPADNNLKWEIDIFHTSHLAIAEIEVPALDTPIVIPDWLQDVILLEVTGNTDFSNYSLSVPLKIYTGE